MRLESDPENEPDDAACLAAFVSPWSSMIDTPRDLWWELKGVPLRLWSAVRPPKSRTVILHPGRTGSTVLNLLLNQQPGVYFEGEYFSARYNYHAESSFKSMKPHRTPVKAMASRRRWRAGGGHFGVEVKVTDLPAHRRRTLPEIRRFLEDAGGEHLVVLRRRNLVRWLISHRKMLVSGDTHLQTTAAPNLRKADFTLDLDEPDPVQRPGMTIEAVLEHVEAMDRVLEILGRDANLELTYEDHVRDDPMVGLKAICGMLGFEPQSSSIPLRRTNPGPIESLITNPDQLERRLRGTRWAWMIDAD